MTHKKICLASDNWAPAHPLVLQALLEANEGVAPSYGSDAWTEKATSLIQESFQSQCKVLIVPTGTGSNILGLSLALRRHESVLCTDIAHIQYQETGAAESLIGCKLATVLHQDGKLTPHGVRKKLATERAFGKHSTSPRVLSITQSTEVGTVYQLKELSDLAELCREENLLLHIDGSRLYNAAVSMGISLHELVKAVKPDIVSLGGTKNGLVGAEALLIFNPLLQEGSDHLQKQMLQLLSKMRYASSQFIPLFTNQLWRDLAGIANQRAQEIAAILHTIPQLSLSYPVETNQIFFSAPASWIPKIQEEIFCYPWNQEKREIRFITSWNTTEIDVKAVESAFAKIAQSSPS